MAELSKMVVADVPIRDYVETLIKEQQRAADVAERERSKAADVLAVGLARSIEEGDARLREHVVNQFAQIAAAVVSAEKLEATQFESLRREMRLTNDASEKAISKAEGATDKRLEGLNAIRGQLADQASTFMLREVAEAQITDLRKQVAELAERLGKLT